MSDEANTEDRGPLDIMLAMESDILRVPRLLEAIRAIAELGITAGSLSLGECEAVHEVASICHDTAAGNETAFHNLFEVVKALGKETTDV